MLRIAAILWICVGAFALGLLVREASRHKREVSAWWYLLSLILGPIFLCFILPMIWGRWHR